VASSPQAGEAVDTVDRETICEELQRVRVTFRRLVQDASPADLARASDGTRWTNQQLLFHMLFGYLLMRSLIALAGMFSRLPSGASREFARLLNAGARPFHWVNYLGSCAGATGFPRQRMAEKMDKVTMALERRLRAETPARLRLGMHYPVRWDPFFKDFMTLVDLYHYPIQHFDFHQRQLTLGQPAFKGAALGD
jgi:DinB family protein